LAIPIFQGGRIEADVQQAEAVLKERQAQVDNLKGGIEQDIENALLDLKAAAEQVEVAKTGLDYAQQALAQSQDRFAAGVTNNVEVIQAQQQLASANDQYIASLFQHNIGKVLLARAIGNAEQAVKQYLSQPGGTVPDNSVTPPGNVAPPNPATPPGNAAPPNPATPGGTGAPPTTTPAPGNILQGPSKLPASTGAVGSTLLETGANARAMTPATTPHSRAISNATANAGQPERIADR
jgi:hypothetical protein